MPLQSFASRDTEELYETGKSRRFGNIASVALRKLDMLHAAKALGDLRAPPGNRLEALVGDRAGHGPGLRGRCYPNSTRSAASIT